MKLMMSLFSWIVHIGIQSASVALRWTFLILRIAMPILIRALWAILRIVTLWLTASVISAFRGIPEAVSMMTDTWQGTALEAGFPGVLENQLHALLRAYAYLVIISGWLTIAILTGIMVRIFIIYYPIW